ncbi:MAG TPA: DUF1152 domain-containing protein [Baekduia sp.]|uniref:DUF1152 domain-containing protein n=1 Tax=Baekduia sp. TaxID=2600305 RepID=UPI002D76D007|nr:DUF1152 domain-containing protein [Baekduia sp.]HET6507674.1 DUF1152 domain-containing protein [Baekduia sp.]
MITERRRAQDWVAAASRVLVVGIGGGGDVAGALAAAEAARALGTDAIVGGLTWERRPVDPLPGPRRLDEIDGLVRTLGDAVAIAGPDTTGPGGFRFCEADMSRFLDGAPVLLVDPHPGPHAIAAGLDAAARHLDCDLVLLLDVGGDVLAHGHEPGLASPLADATVLAAALRLRTPSIGVVFGTGCDGELTPEEVAERLAEVTQAGGDLGDLPLPAAALDRVEASLRHVTTEASAMAVRCARGETGRVPIRNGRRTVPLTPAGGRLICFDPTVAIGSAARLAKAVADATSLEDAQRILTALDVRTELDYEREAAAAPPPAAAP